MIELETEHRKLNFFLFWNEHEDVFWKWMVNDHRLHLIYLIRSF
jgi:hypothetical protein